MGFGRHLRSTIGKGVKCTPWGGLVGHRQPDDLERAFNEKAHGQAAQLSRRVQALQQVVQEHLAGETFSAISNPYDVGRNVMRQRITKYYEAALLAGSKKQGAKCGR